MTRRSAPFETSARIDVDNDSRPLTRARVEHALFLLATIISTRDEASAARLEPIYEWVERELEMMKEDSIQERARRRIAAYIPAGSSKAIA